MFKIVCFLWGEKYTAEHVNKLYRGVTRNFHMPFEFICFTDKDMEFQDGVIKKPLWDKCRYLGGCYNRLFVFDKSMKKLIGERFVCIDLDCVIVNDITPLFEWENDFIINAYQPLPTGRCANDQRYNGAMFMMNAGARQSVWSKFDPETTPARVSNRRDIVGTDQAWIRELLGPNEKTWDNRDGVYEARNVNHRLPSDARIVFFAGNRDPATSKWEWVRKLWI